MRICRFMKAFRPEDLNEIHDLSLTDEELRIIEDALHESRWHSSSLRMQISDYMRDHRVRKSARAPVPKRSRS